MVYGDTTDDMKSHETLRKAVVEAGLACSRENNRFEQDKEWERLMVVWTKYPEFACALLKKITGCYAHTYWKDQRLQKENVRRKRKRSRKGIRIMSEYVKGWGFRSLQ